MSEWCNCSEAFRLRRRIAELETQLGNSPLVIPPYASPFLWLLLDRELVPHDAFFTQAFGVRPDCDRPSADSYLHVVAFKVRHALKKYGIELKTVRGAGYRLDPADKSKLRVILGLERRAA